MSKLTRRAAALGLTSVAAASVAVTGAVLAAEPADAALLSLCGRLRANKDAEAALWLTANGEATPAIYALHEEAQPLEHLVAETPAHTMQGVQAKVGVSRIDCYIGAPTSTDMHPEIAASILRDLMRLGAMA